MTMSCECTYSDSPQVQIVQNSGQKLSEVWKTEATFVGYLVSCSKTLLSLQVQFSFMKLDLSFQKPAARPMNKQQCWDQGRVGGTRLLTTAWVQGQEKDR